METGEETIQDSITAGWYCSLAWNECCVMKKCCKAYKKKGKRCKKCPKKG